MDLSRFNLDAKHVAPAQEVSMAYPPPPGQRHQNIPYPLGTA